MATTVNAGARLDRLPISSFHHRIFWLVGAGMFFDGYDLYVAASVLASTTQTKFSTLPQNLQFISLTFVGMTIGSFVTGFVGDKYGRRFAYQINLLVFGLASIAAAFAQDMRSADRVPLRAGAWPRCRNRCRLFHTDRIRAAGVSRTLAFLHGVSRRGRISRNLDPRILIIPTWGWRPMFIIAGIGSLIVWYLRKNLPESPRWLEAKGRSVEAEALMESIERKYKPLPARCRHRNPQWPLPQLTAAAMFKPPILQRLLVGSWVLITINTLIFGFVIFLPQFFLRQGLTIANSLGYTVVLASASLGRLRVGSRFIRLHRATLEHHRRIVSSPSPQAGFTPILTRLPTR